MILIVIIVCSFLIACFIHLPEEANNSRRARAKEPHWLDQYLNNL